MLKLSDREFKITMNKMLRDLMEKNISNMWEEIGSISREMETLGKNQKEILEIKDTGTEMKNNFYGLISRLDTAE